MSSERPTIGITGEWIGTQAGGLEAYSRSLIAALGQARGHHDLRVYTARRDALAGVAGIETRFLGVQSRALFNGAALPFELLRRPPDLLHVTSIPPLFSRVPYIMTVHDLGHKVMPDMYPPRIRWRLDKTIGMGIRRARHIICVSEATREDLMHYYPQLDDSRVHVIGEGGLLDSSPADSETEQQTRARYGLGQGYFLYVGRLHVRKNLLALVDAFAALPEDIRGTHPLVLVGRAMYGGNEITDQIAALGISEQVILTGHVPDADLPALYRGASAFVYPSLFEGFGLPPLEAMSMGVPVITSDRHSLPEVVGDAGLCVDANGPDQLREAMQSLATDEALRADLIARGLARAKLFTWERAAEQTARIYDIALSETSRNRFFFSRPPANIL